MRGAEWTGETWRLGVADGPELRARFVVDATGRPALIARKEALAQLRAGDPVGRIVLTW